MYTLRLRNLQNESKLPNEPNWIDRRKHVIPVTNAARLGIGQMGLIDACRAACGLILLPVPRLGRS